MWLINIETLELEFFMESKIPKYAILSHTWEDDEVTFQEFSQGSACSKKGYQKIMYACDQARQHGFQYSWVDTCCIDKSSSAELTESINSMYAWYQKAEICYAYLSDLTTGPDDEEKLSGCRWFTRGWTLQELIAPSQVQFYDRYWEFIGTKTTFATKISLITSINLPALMGASKLSEYSISQRMFWAAPREMSRTEDLAYCLLGIFNVNMPLIYGEGSKAFRRLQEEIIKHDNDLSIFAWDKHENGDKIEQSLFSPSPADFSYWPHIGTTSRTLSSPEFSMTNKGLRFDNFEVLFKLDVEDHRTIPKPPAYTMVVGTSIAHKYWYALPLKKIGPNLFLRDGTVFEVDPLTIHDNRSLYSLNTLHIQIEPQGFIPF